MDYTAPWFLAQMALDGLLLAIELISGAGRIAHTQTVPNDGDLKPPAQNCTIPDDSGEVTCSRD
jgi:hypothetical protein